MTPYYDDGQVTLLLGDVREVLRELQADSVNCVVTSPPYWSLRDYGVERQLGLEPAPEEYVANMVEVFREVRRVLRPDGTLWLNIGDSYSSGGRGYYDASPGANKGNHVNRNRPLAPHGMKPKDLVGIPWMLAFALRADGWYLRSDIIWCLSAGTRVYARTQKGEMPTTIRDLVRLDPSTVQLWNGERWTQVRGWSSRRSETLRLTLRSGERIIASPNHRWPLVDERIVETRELQVGDVLATTRLPEPLTPSAIPDDLAWFAGLYLAEGSRSDDAIQIAGHADEVERHERVIDIAERYGGSAVIHASSGNAVSVVVHGALLDGALRHFLAGRTALDKHLHPRAWRSPNATLRALMEGYLAGDGHHDAANGRWRLGFGNNPQLVESLRTLAARLGATLTLSPTLVKMGRTRTFDAYRGEWRWQASDHHNAKQRAEIIAIEPRAESEVWDIGVEDEPHLFALASGVLTHNSKPNPMPESVTDRPTKAHEYLFLLSKKATYFYDAEAIREAATPDIRGPGLHNGYSPPGQSEHRGAQSDGIKHLRRTDKQRGHSRRHAGFNDRWDAMEKAEQQANSRNKRSVWHIPTAPFPEAHFATFPPALVEPCILAGCPEGGVVLDPFIGSGTTAMVARQLGRRAIGIDLNAEYLEMARRRIGSQMALIGAQEGQHE